MKTTMLMQIMMMVLTTLTSIATTKNRNNHIDDIEQACEPQNYDPLTHPLISVDTRATSVVMIMLIIMILMKTKLT